MVLREERPTNLRRVLIESRAAVCKLEIRSGHKPQNIDEQPGSSSWHLAANKRLMAAKINGLWTVIRRTTQRFSQDWIIGLVGPHCARMSRFSRQGLYVRAIVGLLSMECLESHFCQRQAEMVRHVPTAGRHVAASGSNLGSGHPPWEHGPPDFPKLQDFAHCAFDGSSGTSCFQMYAGFQVWNQDCQRRARRMFVSG